MSRTARSSPNATRFVSRYLDQLIDYGGIPCTRAEAILDIQAMGMEHSCGSVGLSHWP